MAIRLSKTSTNDIAADPMLMLILMLVAAPALILRRAGVVAVVEIV